MSLPKTMENADVREINEIIYHSNAALRFGHSDAVFGPFIELRHLSFNRPFIQYFKTF